MRPIAIPTKGVCTALLAAVLTFASCNKDGEITIPGGGKPRITLDNPTGVYTTKVGQAVRIVPAVENGEQADYRWEIDGEVVSTDRVFDDAFDAEGRVFVTLRVENKFGSDAAELRIDVGRLALPVIFLPVPASGFELLRGREYTFRPEVQNGEEARYAWFVNGSATPVCTEREYTFMQTAAGRSTLLLRAENEDGRDELQFDVQVVEALDPLIRFIPPCYGADPLAKSVSLGRKLFLRPLVERAADPEYAWYVDGELQKGQTGRTFVFEPAAEGKYTVLFRVTDRDESGVQPLSRHVTRASAQRTTEVTLSVTCYGPESEREIVTSGRPAADRVVEFLPAPGQFVNETNMAGYAGEKTFEQAREYARKRLTAGEFVSLGGFGGYIVFGFDHSIENRAGYDFSIAGNSFGKSNEPGVVWVMQDVNGNSLPDDEWYELRGSETDGEWTVQDYAVTYYRPRAARQPVYWTDNRDGSGRVAYLEQFHAQDSYYPLWLGDDTYTFYGTALRQNTSQDSGGNWSNNAFGWGYVDNRGSDNTDPEDPDRTFFEIDNAMTPDGRPAALRYIDFIKVQSAVNGGAGALGEVSTEVVGMPVDENL